MEISFANKNRTVTIETEFELDPIDVCNGQPSVMHYRFIKNFGLHFIKKYQFLDEIKSYKYIGDEVLAVKSIHKLDERDVRKNNKNEFLSFVGNALEVNDSYVEFGLPLHGVKSTLILSNDGSFELGGLYRIDLAIVKASCKKLAKAKRKPLIE